MDDIQEDSLGGYYEEETYSKGLNREETIERQIRIVTFYYSKGLWDNFEYSVKALFSLLPGIIRNKFTMPNHDITTEGIEKHYTLFIDMQRVLEEDTNMIFKKKFIKTYQ